MADDLLKNMESFLQGSEVTPENVPQGTIEQPQMTIDDLLNQGSVKLPYGADGSSEESAINQSPLSVGQRFRLAFGNEKGSLKFLKENFEDAKKDKEGNYKVKKDGSWYAVDPTGFGDGPAYSFADKVANLGAEALKDAVDLTDDAISMIGAAIGAGGGAGAASIPGAALGAAAASAANSSLGRWAGTYEAEPEEMLADAALDALLTAGGYGIVPGAKLAKNLAGKGLNKLGMTIASKPALAETAKAVTTTVKNMGKESQVVRGLLRATGHSAGAADHFATSPDTVEKALLPAIERAKRIGITKQLDDMVGMAVDKVDDLVKSAPKVLTRAKDAVWSKADDILAKNNVVVDLTAARNQAMYDKIDDISGSLLKWNGKKLEVTKDAAERLLLEEGLDPKRFLSEFNRTALPVLNKLASKGRMSSRQLGAEMKALDQSFANLIGKAGGNSRQILRELEDTITRPILKSVQSQSKASYDALVRASSYSRRVGGAWNDMRTLLAGSAATRASILNQITADPMKARSLQITERALQEALESDEIMKPIVGKLTKPIFSSLNSTKDVLTARQFVDVLPTALKGGNIPLTAGFIAGDLILNDGVPSPVSLATGAAAALSSPRVAGAAVRKYLRFTGGMAAKGAAPAAVGMTARILNNTIKPGLYNAADNVTRAKILNAGVAQYLRDAGPDGEELMRWLDAE